MFWSSLIIVLLIGQVLANVNEDAVVNGEASLSWWKSAPTKMSIWNKRSNSNSLRTNVQPAQLHKCQTLLSTVQISKDERSPSGQLIRQCQGTATLSKCEGACLSNLRPSINTVTGLLKVLSSVKECVCCRETVMRSKPVILDSCFDADGNLLEAETMTVTVNEPHQCACFQCSN